MGANVMTGDEEALAHRTGLRPVRTSPLMGGFNNILKKELGEWFRPRKMVVQAVIWLAIINGLIAFVLFVVPVIEARAGEPTPEMDLFVTGLTLFFSMLFQAGAIGTMISAQDEIVGEKQTGTAAWILSKPVARVAFVLAKLVATGIGLLVFVVGLTAAVGYLEITLATNRAVDVLPFLGGVGLVSLGLLYFLSLTIMLGTLFDQRAPVIGITLGVLFGGMILVGLVPEIALATPVQVHNMAAALASGAALPANWIVTVLSTVVSILVFSGIAVWRFGQEEF
jgi:ABC-2 type transport system permease protein